MKSAIQRALLLTSSFLLLTAFSPDALSQFEGIVESKNLSFDENGQEQHYMMTMWIKKGMVRIEIPAVGENPAFTAIYRSDLGVSWMLDEASKTFFEIRKSVEPSEDMHSPRSNLRKTGKHKTLLGYPCEQMLTKDGDVESELWVTGKLKGLSEELLRSLGGATSESGSGWNDEIAKMGLFPLKASTKLDGKVVEASEITSIRKVPVEQARFEKPEGFSKQKMEEMPK